MSDHMPVPSQAEAMLRRVSPEGRARALKEQRRRQKAQLRLIGRIVLVALVVVVLTVAARFLIGPLSPLSFVVSLIVFVLAAIGVSVVSRERPMQVAELDAEPLPRLPERIAGWLEAQRPALPPPAMTLVDDINRRLEAMAPQLTKLSPQEPAAGAVRRLVAHDLPDLVERYQSVPASLRSNAGGGGQSPDAHLVGGLQIVDAEIARMTDQLARGAYDELATQSRFLELKYEGEAPIGG